MNRDDWEYLTLCIVIFFAGGMFGAMLQKLVGG